MDPMVCPNCGEACHVYGYQPNEDVRCPNRGCNVKMLTRTEAASLMRLGQMQRAYAEASIPDEAHGETLQSLGGVLHRIYEAIEDEAGGQHEALWTLQDLLRGKYEDVMNDGDATTILLVSLIEPDWSDLPEGELAKRRPRLYQISEKLTTARALDLIARSDDETDTADDQAKADYEELLNEGDTGKTSESGKDSGDPKPTLLHNLLVAQLRRAHSLEAQCLVCKETFTPRAEDARQLGSLSSVWDFYFDHHVGLAGDYCGGLGRLMRLVLTPKLRPGTQDETWERGTP